MDQGGVIFRDLTVIFQGKIPVNPGVSGSDLSGSARITLHRKPDLGLMCIQGDP